MLEEAAIQISLFRLGRIDGKARLSSCEIPITDLRGSVRIKAVDPALADEDLARPPSQPSHTEHFID